MNLKGANGWQLVICLILVELDSPAEGAGECVRSTPVLEWSTEVDKAEDDDDVFFTFKLLNVAKRDDDKEHSVTLYQQVKEGVFQKLNVEDNPSCQEGTHEDLLQWLMDSDECVGDTKIVKAQIKYPDGVMVKSRTLDLENPTAQGEYSAGTLEWENSLKVDVNGDWEIKLKGVPSFGHTKYSVTLYQQLEGDKWMKLQESAEFNHPYEKQTITGITFTIPGSKFQGDSKIVMAEVLYPNGGDSVMLESKTFNLQQLVETASIVGLIVGCVVGGVCLISLVVGCIWYKRRRQRRVILKRPVPVMGQGQQNQVQQVVPHDQYV